MKRPNRSKKTAMAIIMALFALTMMGAFAACGQNDQTADNDAGEKTESAEPVTGGWELTKNEAAPLPEDVQAAFDKATEKYTGSKLTPVAYVGEQIVAGTNYMILCESEPTTSYQMVVVYADLDGNAEVTEVKDFDLAAYTQGDDGEADPKQLAGGWSVPDDAAGSPIPEEAKAAFDKAAESLTGSRVEPLALLGTQVVAGTNYAFICKGNGSDLASDPRIQIIVVYEDLDGKATITSTRTLDPA